MRAPAAGDRAVDAEHRIGSLFLNPGGPGSSGVDFVRGAPPVAFQAPARFDWVGFDPRGVGASKPAIDCDELDTPFPLKTPDTFDLDLLLKRASALAQLCLNRDAAFLIWTTPSISSPWRRTSPSAPMRR
jgi:pimeloyl-ACP methyl ester carboxylesterase